MTRIRALSLFVLLWLAVWPVSAGTTGDPLGDYSVTSWTERDGLPAGRIRAIEQDLDGYLWLATDTGLVRFDGVRFDQWANRVEPNLPNGMIQAILRARDGSLYVSLSGRGPIGRIRDNRLTVYGAAEGLTATYTLSLSEDHTGTVWAGTPQGLFGLHGDRWHKVGEREGLGPGSVLSVFEDRQHRLWVGTTTAVYRRSREGERFEQVDAISVSSHVWQSFSEDDEGVVWISDFKEGFRRSGASPVRAARPARRGWGVHLHHDRRGNFWIGTQGQGLWRVRTGHKGEPEVRQITVNDGLISNAVQSLLEDREGNLWLGTLAGLQRLSPHRVTPIRSLPIPRGVATTADGSVWVGTTVGLTRFSKSGRRDYTEADGLPGSFVLALHVDETGVLWISTERGLTRFANERFTPLPPLPPEMRIQRVVNVTSAGGRLWLRDFALRLLTWHDGKVSLVDDVPDAYRRSISAIFADREGSLWIGAADGSIGVRSKDGEFRSHTVGLGRVLCFYETSDGAVWAGADEGFVQFAGGRQVTVTRQNGFVGGVKSILEDPQGRMWIAAGTGIFRLDRNEIEQVAASPARRLRYRFFNSADGVAGMPFSEGGGTGVRSRDGRLWFVTSSGITVVDPRTVGEPGPLPSPRIENVTADSRSMAIDGQVLLPARTSHLQIAFSALTLSDPMRVRFRYRLDGFDRDWIEAGVARQASYTNLPPRDYRFRVAATSGDGTWTEPGTVLEFNVAPMFYQTRWFYALCGLLLFGLVYASWRLHVRQVRRQFAMVLAERIRMSRTIHDTLLQGLAALALQVDDLSHHLDAPTPESRSRVLRIRRQVEQYIRQARKSIWDLRSPILDSRELSHALRESAEMAIAGRPIELDVSVSGTPRPESAAVDEQLLLIGQEAVSNAVQHGGARRVAVALVYEDDAVRLRVSDDGCGFNPGAPASGHLGLISMRERAEQVRGRLTIDSMPGRGTHIETVVPTT